MNRFLSVLVLTAALAACGSTENNVTNYESEGNLSQSKPIQCKSASKLSSKNNPVDMFIGIAKCIETGEFQNAAELYFAGMSYGYYDTKRVSDKTAHQAISVLRMNIFGGLPQDKMKSFQKSLDLITADKICPTLIELGKPSYFPTYMIQHGMGAFTGQKTKDGLVNDFDPEVSWSESLSKIAKCGTES